MSQTIPTHPKSKIETDPRLDPRIKKFFAAMPTPAEKPNVSSREELLAQENSPAALAALERQTALFDSMDSKEIHGGRMEMSSCFEGNYRTWARMIAAKGVAVAMVEFHNSVHPSEVPEIAPFPAGLNDCISGLKRVHANAAALNIDLRRIIVAGESGGGNLTFAVGMKLKQDGEVGLIQGLYSLVPYSLVSGPSRSTRLPSRMRGSCSTSGTTAPPWPMALTPSTPAIRLRGLASPHARMSRACRRTVVSVNECDPLRDEGIAFYRLLMDSGVSARCRQMMGACHGLELLPAICPDIAHSTASDIANFAIGRSGTPNE
jgi:acetyl esterase